MSVNTEHAEPNAPNRHARQISRQTSMIWATLAMVTLTFSMAAWLDIRSRFDFRMTQFYRRGDAALTYATRLRETTVGIHLALDDIDCFGGSNRGWSSWILRTSPRREFVESGLRAIAASDARAARRVESLQLLWDITGERAHALELYHLAKAAGPPYVQHARAGLRSMVHDDVIRGRLDAPASQPILIIEAEFLEALKHSPSDAVVPDSLPASP